MADELEALQECRKYVLSQEFNDAYKHSLSDCINSMAIVWREKRPS